MARIISGTLSKFFRSNELLLTADMTASAAVKRLCEQRRKAMADKRRASAMKAARTRMTLDRTRDPVWQEMHG